MVVLTIEQARKYEQEERKLNEFGDVLTKSAVKTLEALKSYVALYLAAPYTEVTIQGNAVVYEAYE